MLFEYRSRNDMRPTQTWAKVPSSSNIVSWIATVLKSKRLCIKRPLKAFSFDEQALEVVRAYVKNSCKNGDFPVHT